MLDADEEHAVAEQFGVARTMVRRDHLISHLLAALSEHLADQVLFFGGTALSRTFVPDGRRSEDIDLIALGSRRKVAEIMERTLPHATRREYPGLRWRPSLTEVCDIAPAILSTPDGTSVRICWGDKGREPRGGQMSPLSLGRQRARYQPETRSVDLRTASVA